MTIFRDTSADTELDSMDPRNPDPKGDFAYRAQLEAENQALKAENDQLKMSDGRGIKLAKAVIGLQAEVAQLKADGERLDFLDSNRRFLMGWEVGVAPVGCISVRGIIHGPLSIREAIDAAMKDFSGTPKC
jgi:hypothetical protein